MDSFLELAAIVFVLWRLLLGALGAIGIGLLLTSLFGQFPPAAWFGVGFFGAVIGLVWHVAVLSRRAGAAGQSAPPVSPPVAFLGMAAVGGIWGSVVAGTFGDVVAAIAVALAPWLLGPLFAAIARKPVGIRAMGMASAATLVGFAVLYSIRLASDV
jgi:hypothetical protein